MERYELRPGIESWFCEQGIPLTAPGWFHLRQIWLRRLGIIPEYPEAWMLSEDEQQCMESGYVTEKDELDEDLLREVSSWNSPKTLLDMTEDL